VLARYQLGTIYASLRRAALAGDWPRASELLGQALGCELPGRPGQPEIALALAHRTVRQLSYRGFKPAELAMWRTGLKPVVKMEDIPLAEARAWLQLQARDPSSPSSWSGCGAAFGLGKAYRKDYLLLRSQPCSPGDAQALVCVYAGAAEAIAALRGAEADAREDAVAAGKILAIPDCCASAFAADFAASRADQDALNDDATRRLLAQANATSPGPWQLNPLSDSELLGYYPCSLGCAPSLARAAGVWSALQASDPVHARMATLRLPRPVLWWRMPFFAVLQPSPPQAHPADFTAAGSPIVRYQHFRFNAFADPVARAIQGLLAAHLSPWLDRGDGLSADPGGLSIFCGQEQILRLPSADGMAPLLTVWTAPSSESQAIATLS
jgi:hypothetical protein